MRAIFCDLHGRKFRDHGVTLVYRRIVFNFCARCWRNQTKCREHMQRVMA